MKSQCFWLLCASLLVLLLGVYLHQGFQRKNLAFAAWLAAGCLAQFVAYVSISLGRPWWDRAAHNAADVAAVVLACTAICFAIARWRDPVNRTVALGLAGMLALQFFGLYLAREQRHAALRAWLQNIAFFGPTLWMLFVFSGARWDRLMARIQDSGFRIQAGEIFEASRRVIGA